MTENQRKNIFNVAVSIIVGLLCAALTFFVLILIFFATGLFGWSDGADPKYLRRLELTTNISLWFSIIAAVVIGFLIVTRMNKPAGNSSQ